MNNVQIIEALLFASGDPLEIRDIAKTFELTEIEIKSAIEELSKKYGTDSGIRLLQFGQKVQLATATECGVYIEKLLYPVQKRALSAAALEVLSIIAYKQPVTRGEVEQIRGVKCDNTVAGLQVKGLIKELGRKDAVGRPVLYGTTDEFLRRFGLGSLTELPSPDTLLTMADAANDVELTPD